MKKENSRRFRNPEDVGSLYCPSDLILAGILKSLETDETIEVVAVEKGTIDSFMGAIRRLRPQVILFASAEAMPNMREICKSHPGHFQGPNQDPDAPAGEHPLPRGNRQPDQRRGPRLFRSSTRPAVARSRPGPGQGEIWLPRDKMSSIMDRIISVVAGTRKNPRSSPRRNSRFSSSSARANQTTRSPQGCSSARTRSAPTSRASTPSSTRTAVSNSPCMPYGSPSRRRKGPRS